MDHDHGSLSLLHFPSQIDAFLLFAGDVFAFCVSCSGFIVFSVRLPAERLPVGGRWDRKPAARLCYSLPPTEAARRFSFLLIREMLAWPPREHRSVRRVRSWMRRRLWPRAARGDQISCRVTDSPTALRTATGSASSCTGAAIWAGVTVSFLLAASLEPQSWLPVRIPACQLCAHHAKSRVLITPSFLNCLRYNS